MSRVTVIIPAYNPGGFLQRALQSVNDQTFDDWSCIVVDDGGTEDLAWVDTWAGPRVSRLTHPQGNRGVSVSRNVGVAASSSPLIAFLDQDDEWLPDKLERQVRALDVATGSARHFSCTDFWWHEEGASWRSDDATIDYVAMLGGVVHICLSSAMISREAYLAVGGHDPSLAFMQDWDLFLRLLSAGYTCTRVADPLVRYHLHDANVSRDYLTGAREARSVLERHRQHAMRSGDRSTTVACAFGNRHIDRLYGAKAFDAARIALAERQAEGMRHLGRALFWSPAATMRQLTAKPRQRLRRLGERRIEELR